MGRYDTAVNNAKRTIVLQALGETDWNIMQAAKALGIEKNTIYKVLRAHNITRQRPSGARPS